jgi:Kef-type K+ transport system membrane component KefB
LILYRIGAGAVILFAGLAPPRLAAAPGGAESHSFGPILCAFALLVLAAKAGGILAERFGQPAVLGELLVGVGLGYLLSGIFEGRGIAFVRSEPVLLFLGEVGVLILLFDVGLETDLRSLLRAGWSSLRVALIGVAAPMLLGWGAAAWLLPGSPPMTHLFVGAALAATSVGITSRVLKDLGVMQSPEAQIILGAAVIDDVLGLMILAIVSGAATTGAEALSVSAIASILVRAVLFLGITVGIGRMLSGSLVRLVARIGQPGLLLVVGLALCFILAFASELVGLAGIIGAFAAGLLLDPHGEGVRARQEEPTLSELMHPLSALFVPLFFVLMGIQVNMSSFGSPHIVGLGAVLVFAALVGKLACSLGVQRRGVNRLAVGIGMIPRGEVGLIFAGIGARLIADGRPLLHQGIFSAIILMVLVTTVIGPIGLRWAFSRHGRGAKHIAATSSLEP